MFYISTLWCIFCLSICHRAKAVVVPLNSTVVVTSTVVFQTTVVVSLTTVIQSTAIETFSTLQPTTTVTPVATPQPQNYLGGFDAVYSAPTEHMFYTDQQGSLDYIYYYSNWQRASPAQIAANVKPGSPVSASVIAVDFYSSQVRNFRKDPLAATNGKKDLRLLC